MFIAGLFFVLLGCYLPLWIADMRRGISDGKELLWGWVSFLFGILLIVWFVVLLPE